MGFFNQTAERWVAFRGYTFFDGIDQFVGVVIHFAAALRTDHFLRCHSVSLLAPQRDIIPAVAQRLGHPNKLVQEFIGALDKRLIEKVARCVEYAG